MSNEVWRVDRTERSVRPVDLWPCSCGNLAGDAFLLCCNHHYGVVSTDSHSNIPLGSMPFDGSTSGYGTLEIDAEVSFKWVWVPDPNIPGDAPDHNPLLEANGGVSVSWPDEDDQGDAYTQQFDTNTVDPQPQGINATGQSVSDFLEIAYNLSTGVYSVQAGPFKVHGDVATCGCSGDGYIMSGISASITY